MYNQKSCICCLIENTQEREDGREKIRERREGKEGRERGHVDARLYFDHSGDRGRQISELEASLVYRGSY